MRKRVVLGKRLQQIADIVQTIPNCNRVVDVGIDHGMLLVCLRSRGLACVGGDKLPGPLAQAKRNCSKYGISDIPLYVSNGVENIPLQRYDCLCISGMGAKTMVEILSAHTDEIQHNIANLILQPNVEAWRLRRYLQEQGYLLRNEYILYEKGQYYPILHWIQPTLEATIPTDQGLLEKKHMYIGYYFQQNSPDIWREWLREEKSRMEKILEQTSAVQHDRVQMSGIEDIGTHQDILQWVIEAIG